MDKRLLKLGWAGELASDELAFIKGELAKSKTLRRDWRIRGKGTRVSSAYIRKVAMWGVDDPPKSPNRGSRGLPAKLNKNTKDQQLCLALG